MTGWLTLTDDERRTSLEQATVRSGIQPKAIEKDWWVTLCLKALFNTPYASCCIFKGGTSLSKGWKLIQRFSEDIDIALSPEAFGMEYRTLPSHSYIKRLKRHGCTFTSTALKDALYEAITAMGVPASMITIAAEAVKDTQPDKDPQTLFIRYPSLYDVHPYLSEEVRMEFSVRSLKAPFATIKVQSILSEVFPQPYYNETPFELIAAEPYKTLLEKLFLLHEKFSDINYTNIKTERQSRHLYDIVSLMSTPAIETVLNNPVFYHKLMEHRRHYVRLPHIDYDRLKPGTIAFIPAAELIDIFRKDYEQMQQSMIYGTAPGFDELIQELKILNGRLRLMSTGVQLETVIDQFIDTHRAAIESDPTATKLEGDLLLKLSDGTTVACQMLMHKRKGKWLFEWLTFKE
jgi:hypothetical protein